ncbi:hypothetical protein E2U79_09315 [Salmonella enterica]|nr:hypothetical protein [Salmonella enterica]EIR3572750.1 hypothetical protein [Salmonella enterica]
MWYVIRKKARTTVISALVNAQNISDFISSPHSPESIFSPASSMECGGLYIATVSRKTSATQNSLRNDSFFSHVTICGFIILLAKSRAGIDQWY